MNIIYRVLYCYMQTRYRYTGSSRTFGLQFLLFLNGVPVLFKVNVPPFKSSPVFDNTHTIKYTNLHFIVHWYSSGQKWSKFVTSPFAGVWWFAEVEGSLQNCCIHRRCHDDTDVKPESLYGGMYDRRNLFWYTTNIHMYWNRILHRAQQSTCIWLYGFFFFLSILE